MHSRLRFSIRYRKERHPVAVPIEGSTLLEATWTIIPLALFLIVFVWGALLYFRIYNPPTNAMNATSWASSGCGRQSIRAGSMRSTRSMCRQDGMSS